MTAARAAGVPPSNDPSEAITPHVSVIHGPVNGLIITQNGKSLAIYGDPRKNPPAVDEVLFTHHRRDVAWAGVELVHRGAKAVIPAAESDFFMNVEQFWDRYWTNRFHDYKEQSSRVLTESLREALAVRGGDTHEWQHIGFQVLDTPGYTRGAVSYLFTVDGKRIACVGDLIFGDGRIIDLFSLQDAIAETSEDGYHGYAARAAEVINSLQLIAEQKPDLLVPARGPVIRNPAEAIGKLTRALQALFASHFANDALRWYRGDEKIAAQARRVLGKQPLAWMDMAQTVQSNLPPWVVPIMNSRLIISESGAAFLSDCGGRNHIRAIKSLQQLGKFKTIEGIYLTHYHDDHTDQAQTAADEFNCPVYACREMADILEHPGAYRMPCLTRNPIRHVEAMADGETRRWHEFEMTYTYYPGQTLYHGGLLVKKDGGESIFFVGDSFSPTGIDDYCLLNRDLFEPEKGYSFCLDVLRGMKSDYLIINQHILPAFRFSPAQLDSMAANFRKRRELLSNLFPWDDANFGVDEQWARFYPYGSELDSRQKLDLQVIVLNHSPSAQTFRVTPHAPKGWQCPAETFTLSLDPRKQGSVSIPMTPPPDWHGPATLTADIGYGPWEFRHWTEALVRVH